VNIKRLSLLFVIIFITTYLHANPILLGLRGGNDNSGITLQYYLDKENRVLEGIASLLFPGDNGIEFTGLYEYHFPFSDHEAFGWYIGWGVHLGFYDRPGNTDISLGPDGILGFQYTFENIPLNLSIDWHPGFDIISDYRSRFSNVGISARYVF